MLPACTSPILPLPRDEVFASITASSGAEQGAQRGWGMSVRFHKPSHMIVPGLLLLHDSQPKLPRTTTPQGESTMIKTRLTVPSSCGCEPAKRGAQASCAQHSIFVPLLCCLLFCSLSVSMLSSSVCD